MANPFHRFTRWLSARSRKQRFKLSRRRLREDLLRLHPDAGEWMDVPSFLDQVEHSGLVYDGALQSGVAGLYPVDHAWPQHPTIQVDLINWPREGRMSFWPPLSRTRPAHCLPSHSPMDEHAWLGFTPASLPQVLQQASVLTREAFENNCANASLENVRGGGALERA